MDTYKIVRFFQGTGTKQTIKTGLTREQAEDHCSDPETSSQTCTSAEGKRRTKRSGGHWFDGFYKET